MIVLDLMAHKALVWRVEFSPDGTLLVVAATDLLPGVWNVATRRRIVEPPGFLAGTAASFHPSGHWLIGTGVARGPAIHDFQTRKTREGRTGYDWIRRPRFTADGKTVIYVTAETSVYDRRVVSRSWRPDGTLGEGWSVVLDIDAPNRYSPTGLEIFADGERFATSYFGLNERGRIVIRSLATGEALATGHCPGFDTPDLAVAPDDSLFVAQAKNVLYVWNDIELGAKNVQPDREIRNVGRKHFTGIAFHPSGRFLGATSNDATVKLYDTTTWDVARTFTWDIGKMRSIAFSPDGTLAAAGSDSGKVVVWDVDL